MIVHPDVENYLKELAPAPHPVLEEMEKLGSEQNFPIVGPLVGRFLVSLIQFGHVHTVLECGSGFGYSALWMATALSENAKITCIEYDAKNIELGKEFFQKSINTLARKLAKIPRIVAIRNLLEKNVPI